ncbi:calcium ATPase [Tricholoma matsutake]|nr:calcium ATPase [Tricholoma matsutake 945]
MKFWLTKGSADPATSGREEVRIGFRTLSLKAETLEAKTAPAKRNVDPHSLIGQIDIHLAPTNDVFTRFGTSPSIGLESAAVQRRSKDGKNTISKPPTRYWQKALNYVFGGFNFLMWIAFIVTILSYQPLGGANAAVFNLGVAVLLLLVIIVSSTFYALVDWHASRIMNSIKTLIAEEATVLRDGKQHIISARDLVVGDIVLLSMGDRVPADLRLVEVSSDLKFDRSLLTGESDMVPGEVNATSDNALESQNLALTSTFVVQGACTGVVFAIGDKSVMGVLVAMSGSTKFKLTTVQQEVWFFTKIISGLAISLFIIAIIVWAAWLRKSYPGFETASGAIINSIGCLTAFVPQGLPVCVALSLTIIAQRMAKRNVLIKNLATIETLGCMSVLCSDKTGTLTMGSMSVTNIAFSGEQFHVDSISEKSSGKAKAFKDFHMIARLCNGAKLDEGTAGLPFQDQVIKGDPTDTALLRFAEPFSHPEIGINTPHLLASWEKVFEIPFNSKNKWMLTVVRERKTIQKEIDTTDPECWMLVKGAPDVLFPSCSDIMQPDGAVIALDEGTLGRVSMLQAEWSNSGLRVLALCRRSLASGKVNPENMSAAVMEETVHSEFRGLTLVGLVGIRDPPRPDVPDAIQVIRRAGVRVFMVTGDFKLTAVAIAKQIDTVADMRTSQFARSFVNRPRSDIKPPDEDVDNTGLRALVVTGTDITTFNSEDWDMVAGYHEIVFARTTPAQKLQIVEELKARGDNTVAVTGDGVNDAPAMRGSDIGIAMGSGSDVAKEAASIILLNNDLSSVPVAIEMGRLVFDNLKKVILYLMPAGTYTEFVTVFCNVFLGMQLALSSYLQVCFSITNDVVMSISLMYEKPEADLMLRKPRNARTDRLTDWRFFIQIYLFMGLMMWPCAMSMWFLYMSQQGLRFYDVILVFDKWTGGLRGHSTDELLHFVSVGQCIYYVTMVFMQYGGLLSVRNRRVSIINSNPLWGPRQNLAVPLGMIATALIAVVNLYGQGFHHVFATAPIPGMYWGLPFTFALGILVMDETRKLIVRRYPKSIVAKIAW